MDNSKLSAFSYGLEKDFVKETMKKLADLSAQFNAAIVVYNDQATVALNFTQKFDLNRFLYIMDNLAEPKNTSLTRADIALQVTLDHVFAAQGAGYHLNAPKIAVLVTQGALDWLPLKNVSESFFEKGVRILVVSIVNQLYREMAHPTNVIRVNGFSSLREYEGTMVEYICQSIGECKFL